MGVALRHVDTKNVASISDREQRGEMRASETKLSDSSQFANSQGDHACASKPVGARGLPECVARGPLSGDFDRLRDAAAHFGVVEARHENFNRSESAVQTPIEA